MILRQLPHPPASLGPRIFLPQSWDPVIHLVLPPECPPPGAILCAVVKPAQRAQQTKWPRPTCSASAGAAAAAGRAWDICSAPGGAVPQAWAMILESGSDTDQHQNGKASDAAGSKCPASFPDQLGSVSSNSTGPQGLGTLHFATIQCISLLHTAPGSRPCSWEGLRMACHVGMGSESESESDTDHERTWNDPQICLFLFRPGARGLLGQKTLTLRNGELCQQLESNAIPAYQGTLLSSCCSPCKLTGSFPMALLAAVRARRACAITTL